jgi:hypothetical protein
MPFQCEKVQSGYTWVVLLYYLDRKPLPSRFLPSFLHNSKATFAESFAYFIVIMHGSAIIFLLADIVLIRCSCRQGCWASASRVRYPLSCRMASWWLRLAASPAPATCLLRHDSCEHLGVCGGIGTGPSNHRGPFVAAHTRRCAKENMQDNDNFSNTASVGTFENQVHDSIALNRGRERRSYHESQLTAHKKHTGLNLSPSFAPGGIKVSESACILQDAIYARILVVVHSVLPAVSMVVCGWPGRIFSHTCSHE